MALREALIIGSSTYTDERIRYLPAAVADVAGLERILSDTEIGCFNVTSIIDEDRQTTEEAIESFLLKKELTPDDLILLYFTGHGLKPSNGKLYFACRNTSLDRINSTSVSATWLNELLSASRPQQQIIVLDCCFAGAFAKGLKNSPEHLDVFDQVQAAGLVVMTATGALDYAYGGQAEDDSDSFDAGAADRIHRVPKPSLFTSKFIEGLESGCVPCESNGWISALCLFDYVRQAVQRERSFQDPQINTVGLQGHVPIARGRRAQPGANRHVTLRLTFSQAESGGWFQLLDVFDDRGSLTTIADTEGAPVSVFVPPGSQTGSTVTARGHGDQGQFGGQRGNVLVTLSLHQAVIPTCDLSAISLSFEDYTRGLAAYHNRSPQVLSRLTPRSSRVSFTSIFVPPHFNPIDTSSGNACDILERFTTYDHSALPQVHRRSLVQTIEHADREGTNIAIFGQAGSGKSSILRQLAVTAWTEPTQIGLKDRRIPMLLHVDDLPDQPASIDDWLTAAVLKQPLGMRLPLPENFIDQWANLTGTQWLLLLDGLDTLPQLGDTRRSEQVFDMLEAILADDRFLCIVTSRLPSGPHDRVLDLSYLTDWYEILPFNEDQRSDLVHRWFNTTHQQPSMTSGPTLATVENNPLLLSIGLALLSSGGSIPTHRAALYEAWLSQCMRSAHALARELPKDIADSARALLEDIALHMSIREGDVAALSFELIARESIARGLRYRELEARSSAGLFTAAMSRLSGVLICPNGNVVWAHQTFQEYLAAHAICSSRDPIAEVASFLARLQSELWKGILMFCFLLLGQRAKEQPHLRRGIATLLDVLESGPDTAGESLLFISAMIAEGVPLPVEYENRYVQRLITGAYNIGRLEECADYDLELAVRGRSPIQLLGRLSPKNRDARSALLHIVSDDTLCTWIRDRARETAQRHSMLVAAE